MAVPLLSLCVERLLACLATCYCWLLLMAPPTLATMYSDKGLLNMLCGINNRWLVHKILFSSFVGSAVLFSARC
eukprot:2799428-Pleurochrysis_carterae.AAC.1